MSHYDIFRHHLLITAPAYGHALWDPNPGNLYPAVEVGDVGYIRGGKFCRLFNVLLPANHPSHHNFGVPEYHEQLTLNIENHIDVGSLSPHNFSSKGVTLGPESNRWADGPKREGEVSFSCPMNQGAVLCLPTKAKREDTVASTKFGKWMIRHIDRWFAWARQLELGVGRMEDIILVTGTHRTRSCGNVAFPGGQGDAQVSFRAKVDHCDDIVAINWEFSHERNRGAFLNCGPDGEDLPEDQCIFIRGFRVTRKYRILPRLKGAAGPNPDLDGYDEESDVGLIPVPAVLEYRDPIHILLGLIVEEAPNCDMVLVHDNDLAEGLHGIYDSTPIESLHPDAMLSHLRSAQLKIHEVPFGPDLSSVDNGGSGDTDTVRIATLSNLFGELSPSSTSSSSRSRYHVKTPLPRIERSLLRVPHKSRRTLFQSYGSGDDSATSISHAHPTTSNVHELVEIALKEYEERTGINLLEHSLAIELKSCDSAKSVIEVLQVQHQRSRGHSGNLMMWVEPVVHLLHTLSTSGALGEGANMSLPPAIAIFTGIGVLLDATKHVSAGNDALVDLFESMENLLRPLDICTKIPPTTATTAILIEISIELLSIIALGTQQVDQGLLAKHDTVKLGSNLFGIKGEVVRQRLDRLNQEVARTTAVLTLETVYGLLKNIKVDMNGGEKPSQQPESSLGYRSSTLLEIKQRIESFASGTLQRLPQSNQRTPFDLVSLRRIALRLLMYCASLSTADFASPNGFLGPPDSVLYYPTSDLDADRNVAYTAALDCLDELMVLLTGNGKEEIAASFSELAQALNDLGLHEYASSVSSFALEILRELYTAEPDQSRSRIASVQSLRANILVDLRQNDNAAVAAEEAVTILKEHGDTQPELIYAMLNYAILLGSIGHGDGAAAVAFELTEYIDDSTNLRPDMILISPLCRLCLSNAYVEFDSDRALSEADKAIEGSRASLDADSKVVLAGALLTKSKILSSKGQNDPAHAISAEAVTLFRSVSVDRPVFSFLLAHAIATHSHQLSEANRKSESYSTIHEAVELWQMLQISAPVATRRPLAWALFELAKYRTKGADKQTLRNELQIAESAVSTFREVSPLDHAGLADALYLYADRMVELDNNHDAATYAEESVQYFRKAREASPHKYALDLIFSLSLASSCLACTERSVDALEYAKQAVEVQRERKDDGDPQYDNHLRKLLMDVVFRSTEMGSQQDALPWIQELQQLSTPGDMRNMLPRRGGKPQPQNDMRSREQTSSAWLGTALKPMDHRLDEIDVKLDALQHSIGVSTGPVERAIGIYIDRPSQQSELSFGNWSLILHEIKQRIEPLASATLQRLPWSNQREPFDLVALHRIALRLLMYCASLSTADFASPNGFLGPPDSVLYYPTSDLDADRNVAFTAALDCLDELMVLLTGNGKEEIAASFSELAQALNDLGLHEYASSVSSFALEILRELYTAEPDQFRSRIASVQSLRANILVDLRQNDNAAVAAMEAVTILKEHGDTQPELIYAMLNYAILLGSIGHGDGAAAVAFELTEYIDDSTNLRPDMILISPLCRLCFSNAYAELDSDRALSEADKVIEASRASLDADSKVVLAGALLTKSKILSSKGQNDPAHAISAEAVTLFRSVSVDRPVFSFLLAHAIATHSHQLSEANRKSESYSTIHEAVELWQMLQISAPVATKRPLAWALLAMAKYRTKGADKQTLRNELQIAESAVSAFRGFSPLDYAGLADALYLCADRMLELDKNRDAAIYAEESARYFRKAREESPHKYTRDLIFSLSLASSCLACTERSVDALEYAKQAVEVQRERKDDGDPQYDNHLRKLLMDVIFRSTEMGSQQDALPWLQELQRLSPPGDTGNIKGKLARR
ncbi:hypothetical protein BJY52DRAFT_907300 [Lactarius psammicola]|nr:hypothetical protein BJY52DRAFT_907300 [Lactarius psammicola]